MTASMSSSSRHSSQASARSHWTRTSTKRKSAAKTIDQADETEHKDDGSHRSRSQTAASDSTQRERKKDFRSNSVRREGMHQTKKRPKSSRASCDRSRKSQTVKTSTKNVESHSSHGNAEDRIHRSSSTNSSTQSKSRSRHFSPPRRLSLPAAVELEVTPDDSISQVAARSEHRSNKRSRPSAGRRDAYARLAPIAEAADDAQRPTMAPRDSSKRHSFFASLFGRRNTAPAVLASSRLVQCLTCGCNVSLEQSAKLECGHGMCNDCMSRGLQWQSCDCVPPGYTRTAEGDRLLNMRVPRTIVGFDRRDAATEQRPMQLHSSRRPSYTGKDGSTRPRHEQLDEDLVRRMQHVDVNRLNNDDIQERGHYNVETWAIGNAAGHFMNDDFVQNETKATMSTFGDANMGRRGERESGRRKRPKEVPLPRKYSGLAPNFLGDESVLGVGPAPRESRYPR